MSSALSGPCSTRLAVGSSSQMRVKHGLTRSPYIQMRRAAYSAPFVILVHAHLSLEWGATAAERLSYVLDCDAMTMTPMTAPSAGGTSTRSKRTSIGRLRAGQPSHPALGRRDPPALGGVRGAVAGFNLPAPVGQLFGVSL